MVKKEFFGLDILVKRAVIVEMVMGDVAKDSPGEVQASNAALVGSMGANLHKDVFAAFVAHLSEEGLQAQRIGCGMG